MIILSWLMWIMFALSLMISLVTIVVAYGIKYIPMFATLLPLEISLAITFFLWGINSLYELKVEKSQKNIFYSLNCKSIFILIFGVMLLVFSYFGIY